MDRPTGARQSGATSPVIVLMPTRGNVCAETTMALINNTRGHDLHLYTVNRRPVDTARNMLAARALELDPHDIAAGDDDPFVFWIDSDAFFLNGTMTLMMHEMRKDPTIALLAAYCGPRAAFAGATAYADLHDPNSFPHPGVTCEIGAFVDVKIAPLHFAVHRRSLLERVGTNPFGDHAGPSSSEDAMFSQRIGLLGERIVVATGIPVFHIDERDGAAYLPGAPAMRVVENAVDTETPVPGLPLEHRDYGARMNAILARLRTTPRSEGSV